MLREQSRKAGWFTRFLRCENAAVTVDFVLWLPLIIVIIAIIADTSLIFGSKAQVLRIVQDANRAASTGRFGTGNLIEVQTNTAAYIRSRVILIAPSAVVGSVVTAGVISSTVTIPGFDLTATGNMSGLGYLTIHINAQQLLEA